MNTREANRKNTFSPSVGADAPHFISPGTSRSEGPAPTRASTAPSNGTGTTTAMTMRTTMSTTNTKHRADFWVTAPSLHQLAADPALLASASLRNTSAGQHAAAMAMAASVGGATASLRAASGTAGGGGGGATAATSGVRQFVMADGPVNPAETLIRYDIPFAPDDPKRSLRLRKRLGMMPHGSSIHSGVSGVRGGASSSSGSGDGTWASTAAGTSCVGANNEGRSLIASDVDANVRIVLDSFILPRRWVDPETGVAWEQHAWPFPSSRTATIDTHRRLTERMTALGAKRTGTCPVRTVLVAECILEMLRQVVTEGWERGLLLLSIHAERVAAQAAHRELFESRVGHAMRLALKGEKDATHAEEDIADLKARVLAFEEEERHLRSLCGDFAAYAAEQTLIAERQHSEVMNVLRKEGLIKRNQLEQLLAVPPPQ